MQAIGLEFFSGEYRFNTNIEYLILDKNVVDDIHYEIYKFVYDDDGTPNKVLIKRTKNYIFIENFVFKTWFEWFNKINS